MKELKSLIRLKKWGLDEKRRDLAELENLKDELQRRAGELDAEMERERGFVEDAQEPQPSFPDFLKQSLKKRAQLSRSIEQTQIKINAVQNEITVEFEALKQAETALKRAEERETKKRQMAEQAELDEIASIGHQRRRADVA
ncbi:MAG: flagellar FliJ family protein [Pseudomonadota bacterium]